MKKQLMIIVIAIIVAIVALVPMSIASANDDATPTPGGSQSGYISQGTPVNLTSATPAPDAVVVTPSIGVTAPAGSSDWPQNYEDQPFTVQAFGEAGQDGWSWTNWSYLVVTLTEAIENVVVFWDNWVDNSQDGYGSFGGNAGDSFIIYAADGVGISQADFFVIAPTPTPTGCPKKECTLVTFPPEKLVCQTRFGEAGAPLSVKGLQTIDGQTLKQGTEWWVTFDNVKGDVTLHFASGDLRSTLLVATLSDGSKKKVQMDPTFGAVYNLGTENEWYQSNCWRVDEQVGTGSVTVQTHEASANPTPVCINKP
jgi:hypothetical protein